MTGSITYWLDRINDTLTASSVLGTVISPKPELADAFGRLRVSEPTTVFDSQMQYNTQPLLWAEKLVGAGAVTHNPDESSASLTVGTASGDRVVRQSREYIRYQPGKSQQILITGTFDTAADQSNRTQLIGYGDDENGIFWGYDSGGLFLLLRSNVTGSVSDARKVYQADFNVNKLDGTGTVPYTIDPGNAQIFAIDFEWLGVGEVYCWIGKGRGATLAHIFNNSNENLTTYMTTANLPVRYEISNSGVCSDGAALKQICASVNSEGGFEKLLAYPASSFVQGASVPNGFGSATCIYALRHATTFNSITNRALFDPTRYTVNAESGNVFTQILYNPTITGGSWGAVNSSSIMEENTTATGFSGGIPIDHTFVQSSAGFFGQPGGTQTTLSSRLPYGLDVDGANPITVALIAWSDSGGTTGDFTFNWLESR